MVRCERHLYMIRELEQSDSTSDSELQFYRAPGLCYIPINQMYPKDASIKKTQAVSFLHTTAFYLKNERALYILPASIAKCGGGQNALPTKFTRHSLYNLVNMYITQSYIPTKQSGSL